jgi:hypothetical protein
LQQPFKCKALWGTVTADSKGGRIWVPTGTTLEPPI